MYQYKSLNPPMSAACLPLESEYVDDVDLISEDEDKLQQILSIETSVLNAWSLQVNEQKTEFVKV